MIPVMGRRLFALGRLRMALERHHPRDPHWYLYAIGVRPDAQGRGLGSQLMMPVLAECDREGVGAYLETADPRNHSFYQRFGFEIVGEVLASSAPKIWLMSRPSGGGQAPPR